ncbi:MAG: DUF4386 domain-containing protein [Gammaproteobacteria bacterium]
MNISTANMPPAIYARFAGLLYLIIIVFGISSEFFIRASLIVPGDASATASNIVASQSLFRLGFVFDSIMLLADVAIAIIFYVLFKPVNQIASLIAAAFRLMQAAILGFNLLNYHAALLLASGEGYLAAFKDKDLHSLAMFFLDLHSHGYDLGLIFFGVSNLILGYLVIKSNYFPLSLGYGLIGGALVYLLGSYSHFIFPDQASLMEPLYIIPLLAELSFCLWLLLRGIRAQN